MEDKHLGSFKYMLIPSLAILNPMDPSMDK
jgi:hypothetical protein